MSSNAFTCLANIRLPSPSRLFPASCSPDKDLVVLISRLGGVDRMSLWHSTQASRVWEADVGDGSANSHVVGISWSPDGQSIAVASNPPSISFHSVQDGHNLLSLPIEALEEHPFCLTGIWWFRDGAAEAAVPTIPDIFKRGDTITGSAQSILNMLPLLDSLQEDSEKLTATDLFAFQGSHTRTNLKSQLPSVINTWPTLASDPLSASISASSHTKVSLEGSSLDEIDTSNINSLLLVADNMGRIFYYLDGTFPLGFVSVSMNVGFASITKHPSHPCLLGQTVLRQGLTHLTSLRPAVIQFPLLAQGISRDLARLSSTARELVWYMLRVVKEMREAWYGSESNTGARELGPKWVQSLAIKQRDQFGQENTSPILDLVSLLTTGRASEALLDLLGSGEQMSERGIQKWESTVSEALIKLRDFAEKRVAPACQRLHVVLDEIKGWARLPQYNAFELSVDDITACLDLAGRGIIITSWLAAVSRSELSRFREFISWLRYEVSNINVPSESNIPRHDILEVNQYFMTGLASSSIDKWFVGPVPQFQPVDLGIPAHGNGPLNDVLDRACKNLCDSSQIPWPVNIPKADLNNLDRNLDLLTQSLAQRCQRIFKHAAGATSRSAVVSFDSRSYTEEAPEKASSPELPPFRERTVINERGDVTQHLVARIPPENNKTILLIQLQFNIEASKFPSEMRMVLLECYLPQEDQEDGQLDLDLLEADFFDDDYVVIIYRLRNRERQTYIATLNYNDAGYQNVGHDLNVKSPAREDLMQDALELWKTGQLVAVQAPINRHRLLTGFLKDGVSLVLNGRIGRRIACVLDGTGTVLETIDLEGDAEDMEIADDTRA